MAYACVRIWLVADLQTGHETDVTLGTFDDQYCSFYEELQVIAAAGGGGLVTSRLEL